MYIQFLYIIQNIFIFENNKQSNIASKISDFFDYKNIKNGDIEMPLDDTPEKRQIQFKAKFASLNPSGDKLIFCDSDHEKKRCIFYSELIDWNLIS